MVTMHAGRHRVAIDLPPSWERAAISLPAPAFADGDVEAMIDAALDAPYGSDPLEKLARSATEALIIAPDRTRPGPWAVAIGRLARRLEEAGVAPERITVLVATGTHRPMTDEELVRTLGSEVVARHRVCNHDHAAADDLVHLGTTPHGTPIDVNRRVLESDLVVSLGSVKPHRVAGWSGGAKLIQPGVTSNATTAATHWLSARFPAPEMIGVVENPVRHEMEEVARSTKLDFSLNVVLNRAYRAVAACAGHFVEAHRAAVARARPGYIVRIDGLADVVIAANPPQFRDMWAVGSGPNEAELLVRDGGAMVTLLDVPEGVARQHPEVERWGYGRTYAEVAELVAQGRISDLNAAAHLEHAGGKLWRKHLAWYAWAPALDDALLARLGAVVCSTPQEAVDRAVAAHGTRPGSAYLVDGSGPWEFLVESNDVQHDARKESAT